MRKTTDQLLWVLVEVNIEELAVAKHIWDQLLILITKPMKI